MAEAWVEKTYAEIAMGEKASFRVLVDESLVERFAQLSGDRSPIHIDASYAVQTSMGKRVAHGMIIGALFSRLIGMHLPGKYSLYLSQTLRFHSPIFLNTELEIRGEITHKTDAHKTVTIRATAEDAATKKILVSGEALVQLLK